MAAMAAKLEMAAMAMISSLIRKFDKHKFEMILDALSSFFFLMVVPVAISSTFTENKLDLLKINNNRSLFYIY